MTQVASYTLHYQRDSASLVAVIGQLYGATCLDSGLGKHPNARYDILSALPEWELRAERKAQQTVFYHKFRRESDWSSTTEDHFPKLCQTIQDRFRTDTSTIDQAAYQSLLRLPFAGGFMGILGYHFLQDSTAGYREFPATPPHMPDLKSMPDAWIGWYSWVVIVDHQTQSSHLVFRPECEAGSKKTILALLAPWLSETPNSISRSAAEPLEPFYLQKKFNPMMSEQAYYSAFDQLQHWIHDGDCYQTNLAMPFTAPYQGNPLSAYLALRQVSQSPFSAYVSQFACSVLSLSPERFIKVDQRNVITQPIKGTRPRFNNTEQDCASAESLTQSEKDKAENLMIVDLLRNDLGKICETGSVKVDALFELQSFSQVHHLVSTIRGTLPEGVSALELLLSAFPGGSITGAPKIRAMQIIAELESVPRSAYCGSVFYLDEFNRLDSNIAIRTLVCSDRNIYCWGGSGVVSDSIAEDEYQECYDKVSALLAGLTLKP